jgi:hypothetical protein
MLNLFPFVRFLFRPWPERRTNVFSYARFCAAARAALLARAPFVRRSGSPARTASWRHDPSLSALQMKFTPPIEACSTARLRASTFATPNFSPAERVPSPRATANRAREAVRGRHASAWAGGGTRVGNGAFALQPRANSTCEDCELFNLRRRRGLSRRSTLISNRLHCCKLN